MDIYKGYFKKYKILFTAAVSCVFFEAICDLLQPTIMARIIDQGVKNNQVSTVIELGLLMLVITALGAGFAATRNILASKVSQSLGADLRYDVFSKVINLSEISADKFASGSLITRMTNDTAQIVHFINGLMRILLKAPLLGLGSIVFAVILSPQLSLVLFIVVAIVTVFIVISMKMSYLRFSRVQYAIDKVNTVVQEYLMGVRLVKAFGRYEDENEKFNVANTDLYHKSVLSQLVVSYFSPLISLTVSIGIALILYLGSLLFSQGKIEVGKVAAFINYMVQILASLIMVTNVFNTFVRTKASVERVNEVLNSGVDFPGSEEKEQQDYGQLTFDDVSFSYANGSGKPVLKNLSFQVNQGETLAIIGPTGAGKSTIAWLCLRFYDVDKGAIYFNGSNIKNLDTNTLRNNIALAPQKAMLFKGTVFENIVWGNPKATLKEAMEAARGAQADEFIEDLPDKYNSIIGQDGVNLSGGQKQRIAIARALVKKAPVLILDDSTSALDAVTEAKVRDSLKTVWAEKTIIVITQRIGTAMSADKILVLDQGMNVGFGSHQELLRACKTYREIFESQIGGNRGYQYG